MKKRSARQTANKNSDLSTVQLRVHRFDTAVVRPSVQQTRCVFSRPYWRSRLCYTVASVCRLSSSSV